jgi:hypothetical protein
VVERRRVALLEARERRLGELGLEAHHLVRVTGGLRRLLAGQTEDSGDVRDVLLARRIGRSAAVGIVVAVREAQTALIEPGHIVGRVVRIHVRAVVEDEIDAAHLERSDLLYQPGARRDAVDVPEPGPERGEARRLDGRGVHAAGVEGAQLAGGAALRLRRALRHGLVQDRAYDQLVVITHVPVHARRGVRRGDRVVRQPGPVGVLHEVDAGVRRLVDERRLEHLERPVGGRERRRRPLRGRAHGRERQRGQDEQGGAQQPRDGARCLRHAG